MSLDDLVIRDPAFWILAPQFDPPVDPCLYVQAPELSGFSPPLLPEDISGPLPTPPLETRSLGPSYDQATRNDPAPAPTGISGPAPHREQDPRQPRSPISILLESGEFGIPSPLSIGSTSSTTASQAQHGPDAGPAPSSQPPERSQADRSNPKLPITPERFPKCEGCNKEFTRAALKCVCSRHAFPPVSLPFPKLTLASRRTRTHLKRQRPDQPPPCKTRFPCPARDCDKDYARPRELERHKAQCRSLNPPTGDGRRRPLYQCICGRTFPHSRWDKFTEHHKRMCEAPRVPPPAGNQFICQCGKEVGDFASFKEHRTTHYKPVGRPRKDAKIQQQQQPAEAAAAAGLARPHASAGP